MNVEQRPSMNVEPHRRVGIASCLLAVAAALAVGASAPGVTPPSRTEEPTAAAGTADSRRDNLSQSGDSKRPLPTDDSGADEEVIEILHQGKIYRVPVSQLADGPIPLGDSGWKLLLQVPRGDGTKDTNDTDDAANASNPPADSTTDKTPILGLRRDVFIALTALGGALLVVVLFFLVVQPAWRRRTLKRAWRILADDQQERFDEAEELLDRSLLAGLRRGDVQHARFGLAYVRARLGRYDEAAAVLADLEKAGGLKDSSACFLALWVHSKLEHHERVERLWEEYGGSLRDDQRARMMASIAYLELARMHWARREVEGAMHYFDRVRELELLAEEIPTHIDDHEVLQATVALFEDNLEEARRHFRASVEAARKQGKPSVAGELGLLLCEWRHERGPQFDSRLCETVGRLQSDSDTSSEHIITECTHCGRRYRIGASREGRKVACRSCKRRFTIVAVEADEAQTQVEEETAGEGLLTEQDVFLRNARLWLAVSLLREWLDAEPRSGLPADGLSALDERLQAVTSIDAAMGDPYLIQGLVHYYFAATPEQRAHGRSLIERAVDLDVHVPEVLQLLERERKLVALQQDLLAYVYRIARDAAENPEFDPTLRRRLIHRLRPFERFKDLEEVELGADDNAGTPSVRSLTEPIRVLARRLGQVTPLIDDPEIREEVERMHHLVEDRAHEMEKQAHDLQQATFEVTAVVAEGCLKDDRPESEDSQATDQGEDDGPTL